MRYREIRSGPLLAALVVAMTFSAPAGAQDKPYVHEQSYREDRFSTNYCKCYSVSKSSVLGGNTSATVRQSFSRYRDAVRYRNELTARNPDVCEGCRQPLSSGSTEDNCQTVYGLPC